MTILELSKRRLVLGVLLFVFVVGAVLSFGEIPLAVSQPVTIQAKMIKGPIPMDGANPIWESVPGVVIPLSGQTITTPMHPNISVKSVFVKAITNGKDIGIRLDWADQSKNDTTIGPQHFRDQAAIQFPVNTSGAPPFQCMGQSGGTVNIWRWNAEWQKDLGKDSAGIWDVDNEYPAIFWDYYFEEPAGGVTYLDRIGRSLGPFNPGIWSGNIMSDPEMRIGSVEDISANGFTTLTTQAHQDVVGNGLWEPAGSIKGGCCTGPSWRVVFKRALTTSDANDVQLKLGMSVPVAFAVWDGQNVERDGMKGISTWFSLQISEGSATAKVKYVEESVKPDVQVLHKSAESPAIAKAEAPAPALEKKEQQPLKIFWNIWPENSSDPRFKPLRHLHPDQKYRISVDLSSIKYRAPGALSIPTSQAFSSEVEEWIKAAPDEVSLKLVLLPDERYFKFLPKVADFKIKTNKLRALWENGEIKSDDDAFDALAKSVGKDDPEFKLGGTVFFDVLTGEREGLASLALSIWHENRPIDQFTIPMCITVADATIKEKCGEIKEGNREEKGLSAVRLASEKGELPDASLQFVELDKQATVIGIFRHFSWEKNEFLVWSLNQTGNKFRSILTEEFLQPLATAFDDTNLLHRGENLFDFLFPKKTKAFNGKDVRTEFRNFVMPSLQKTPGEEEYTPPSIFVRMTQLTPDPSLPIPLGLLAIRMDDTKEMTIENGRFLGYHFMIETPLEAQTYQATAECIARWVMVLPGEDTNDSAINDALSQMGDVVPKWSEEEALSFHTMRKFREWIRKDKEDASTTLVTLSHHDKNQLYFYGVGSRTDDPITHRNVARVFTQPSIAVLSGCGTGGEGAVEMIRQFNQKGFAAIIASSTEVNGLMAGALLNVLTDEIKKNDGTRKKVTLSRAYWRALQRLSKITPAGVKDAIPYGGHVLKFSLLGNGGILLCPPAKKNRPLESE